MNPDLNKDKVAQEVNELEILPNSSVQIHPVGALAIISLVQSAIICDPKIRKLGWTDIGIEAAQQLQKDMFNEESEIYKVMESRWDLGLRTPETSEPIPSDQV